MLLDVSTDLPLEVSLRCPHRLVGGVEPLGPAPVRQVHAHVGDTVLIYGEDAGVFYAEPINAAAEGATVHFDRKFRF